MTSLELDSARLAEHISESPQVDTVLENLLQIIPETGCVQGCAHCSQEARAGLSRVPIEDIEVVCGALGRLYKERGVRNSFKEIYPYKDNDPALYPALDVFSALTVEHDLRPLRISTQGFSRHRDDLTAMHTRLAQDPAISAGIGRTRLSFALGIPALRTRSGREEYLQDTANFLDIYRSQLGGEFERSLGKGESKQVAKFGVFLRYMPEISVTPICYQNNKAGVELRVGEQRYHQVADEVQKGERYATVKAVDDLGAMHEITEYRLTDFFPETSMRLLTIDGAQHNRVQNVLWQPGDEYGVLTDRVRYFSQARDLVRGSNMIDDEGTGATEADVDAVLRVLHKQALRNEHIRHDIVPLVELLWESYQRAGYSPEVFFHRGVTKDAGVLSNQGRASNAWRKAHAGIVPDLPANDREFEDMASFVDREGEAYAIAPLAEGTGAVHRIDRVNYVYQPLQDSALVFPYTAHRVTVAQEGLARVGFPVRK